MDNYQLFNTMQNQIVALLVELEDYKTENCLDAEIVAQFIRQKIDEIYTPYFETFGRLDFRGYSHPIKL